MWYRYVGDLDPPFYYAELLAFGNTTGLKEMNIVVVGSSDSTSHIQITSYVGKFEKLRRIHTNPRPDTRKWTHLVVQLTGSGHIHVHIDGYAQIGIKYITGQGTISMIATTGYTISSTGYTDILAYNKATGYNVGPENVSNVVQGWPLDAVSYPMGRVQIGGNIQSWESAQSWSGNIRDMRILVTDSDLSADDISSLYNGEGIDTQCALGYKAESSPIECKRIEICTSGYHNPTGHGCTLCPPGSFSKEAEILCKPCAPGT